MDFRSRIQARRIELGLTKEELGRRLGCTGVHVGTIENGVRGPSPKLLVRMEEVLGFDHGELTNAWYAEKHAHIAQIQVELKEFPRPPALLPTPVYKASALKQLRQLKTDPGSTGGAPSIDLGKPIPKGKAKQNKSVWMPWGTPYDRVAVQIADDDMAPEIMSGDIVIVDMKQEIASGQLVLFEDGRRVTVRRFTHAKNARILDAASRSIQPVHLLVEERNLVFGPVVMVIRGYANEVKSF